MRAAIRKNALTFTVIIGLVVLAAGVGTYILAHERLRFPFQKTQVTLRAAFSTAQAVTPGQGQTLRVSGVRIGDISGVDLQDGRAIVTFKIDPRYKGLVHTNASALLRPKTGLKDMFVELNPGTPKAPVAKDGWTIPISSTLPDVNPDEILSALDGDTRAYLELLVNGAGEGLAKRGTSLQQVFRRFEPTTRDIARVSHAVAGRRVALRRLVHSLNLLNGELASNGPELSQLVDASSSVFHAFAGEQANVSRTVKDLPPALAQTTTTLGKVQRYAKVLGPTADALRAPSRSLDVANRATRPFVREATPILARKIRPFVRDARPVVRQVRPSAQQLATATPDLTSSFVVLNHLFNLLGFNPNGREGPEVKTRDEGYLFWIAWLQHNGAALFSTSDANGDVRPITISGACQSIKQVADQNPPLNMVLAPALLDPKVCGA